MKTVNNKINKTFLQHTCNKKNSGENLLEVLVSMAILALVLTSTFALLARSTSANINVKNRIIAINIAREGIEAVRNIRDTNWLKYSGDRRNKWLCLDTVANDCDEKITTAGLYTIDFSETAGRYFLTQIFDNTNTENIISPENMESTPSAFSSFRLFQDATSKKLTYISAGNIGTPFYRQIELTPAQTEHCGNSSCDNITELSVIVRVFWIEDETGRTMTLETTLYDFLSRDSY